MASCLATIVGLSGCANLYPPSSKDTLASKESYWMSYDASRRGTIVISGDEKIRACSEPAPDVALSFVSSLKGGVQAPAGTTATNIDTTLSATAQALAGRDDLVLLAREALFRICEAHMNGTLQAADVKPLFLEVFKGVRDIAVAQADTAKGKAQAAQADLEKTRLMVR